MNIRIIPRLDIKGPINNLVKGIHFERRSSSGRARVAPRGFRAPPAHPLGRVLPPRAPRHSVRDAEAVSLAAAKATIAKLRDRNVIEHVWTQGRMLRDGYNALAAEVGMQASTGCVGFPPWTVVAFQDAGGDSLAMKSLYQQEMIKRGVLIGSGFNLCFAHSDDDVTRTLAACRDALGILARAVATDHIGLLLEGPATRPVFRNA